MKATSLLVVSIVLSSLLLNSTVVKAQQALELNDDNWEHDTQATTGSTTGDWLILFCEFNTKRRCQKHMEFWNELAGVLRGQTTVAYVNVQEQDSGVLKDMFEISYNKTPDIRMLHKGHFYKYQGAYDDQEALIDFAVETFHNSEHKEQVMRMPGFLDEIKDLFNYSVRRKGGLVNAMLMKDEDGQISYGALVCVYIVPLLVVYGFYKLMSLSFQTDSDTVGRTKVMEELNKREKQKIESWIQKHPTLRRKHRKWE